MIEGHGDDIFRYKGRVRINFSTNIPQGVNHDGLVRHLFDCGAIFRNYPEPEPRSVESRLANRHGVPEKNVIVTNGATEAIYLIAQYYAGKKSVIIAPTFREYQDACRVFCHEVKFINGLGQIDEIKTDLVWLCNPNNPSGCVYERSELLSVIDRYPERIFIIDQAYGSYAVTPVLCEEDVMARRNVVLLNSLTKQFVVPGLRIGYAIAPDEVVEKLRGIRMPWSVNSLAIEAAHYLLEHEVDYAVDYEELHRETLRLGECLKEMGIRVQPSDCNFILAVLPDRTALQLKEWLIEKHGILIRDASNFEGLTSRHFRIATQTKEENNKLIDALKEWISL